MTTFLEYEQKVYRALALEGESAPARALVLDGLIAAQEAILERVGKKSTYDWTGDGSTIAFALPSDCYEIQGIREVTETGKLIPSAVLAPGSYFGDYPEEQNFLEYPEGYVTFGIAPESGDTVRLYYTAYWPLPSDPLDETGAFDEAEDLAVPKKVERAVFFYTCAYCLLPDAVSASSLRQFNTRVDSGNPEHNPVEATVKFFMHLYEVELAKIPFDTGGTLIG